MIVFIRSISAVVAWIDGNGMGSICDSIRHFVFFPQWNTVNREAQNRKATFEHLQPLTYSNSTLKN